MRDLEAVREEFGRDRFVAGALKATIEAVGEDYAKCAIRLEEIHKNAGGAVMGGVMFALADHTFAVATDAVHTRSVTLSAEIMFIAAPRGEQLIAEAFCLKKGRNHSFYRVDIKDETGRMIAAVSVTGANP